MNNVHSIAYSSDDTAEIRPRFKLRFERLLNSPGRGLCLVDISLENNGAIAASCPFLCFTALGLNVTAASNWAQRDIKMVRKMKRLAPIKNDTLEPRAEVQCCTVILRSNFNSDGCLEFERGNSHPLATLPDLNLFCVVGAGNYPSKRILLTVPSSALKAVIGQKDVDLTDSRLARA